MSKTDKNLMEAYCRGVPGQPQIPGPLPSSRQGRLPGRGQTVPRRGRGRTVHALAHLKAARKIGTTAENLKEAPGRRNRRIHRHVPDHDRGRQAEGNKIAERSFNFANEVEKIHAGLYQRALDELEEKKDADYVVCTVCATPPKANRRIPARYARPRPRRSSKQHNFRQTQPPSTGRRVPCLAHTPARRPASFTETKQDRASGGPPGAKNFGKVFWIFKLFYYPLRGSWRGKVVQKTSVPTLRL